jgi:soluble lytic murein transglycosylase-like protein
MFFEYFMINLLLFFSFLQFFRFSMFFVLFGLSLNAAMATSQVHSSIKPLNKCIAAAADYHGVNPYLLRAILVVESQLNPKAININKKGLVVTQTNSALWLELVWYCGLPLSHPR